MKQRVVGVLILILSGCGNGGSSDSNIFSSSSSHALESGGTEDNLNFIGRNALKQSGLVREFDVDLFNQSPLQQESKIYLSNQNIFRISLKTLDLLPEEKRFPLIQADEIISNGLPTIIPPKGYTVRLEIVDNQVIAVMKSTTAPEEPDRTLPVHTGNNDIIVGDLRRSLFLLKGTSHALSHYQIKKSIGLQAFTQASSQYFNYTSSTQWFGQISTIHGGMDKFLSIGMGKCWDFLNVGTIQASIHHIRNYRDIRSLEMASIKYSTYMFEGYEGHIIFTTTLDQPWNQAVGIGVSMFSLPHNAFHMNLAISNKIWSISAIYELNL